MQTSTVSGVCVLCAINQPYNTLRFALHNRMLTLRITMQIVWRFWNFRFTGGMGSEFAGVSMNSVSYCSLVKIKERPNPSPWMYFEKLIERILRNRIFLAMIMRWRGEVKLSRACTMGSRQVIYIFRESNPRPFGTTVAYENTASPRQSVLLVNWAATILVCWT